MRHLTDCLVKVKESCLKGFLGKGGPKSFKVKYYSSTNPVLDNLLLGSGDTVGNKTVFMEIIRKGRRHTNIIHINVKW